ncbi:transposon Tf2-8 polyprotein [Trichonephila clavipes]|nr:transposon Tf2-8 polyprotein [Trichonephila clavipes]
MRKKIDRGRNRPSASITSSVKDMQQAIWAIFLLSTDEKPQHGFCPSDSDTWDLANPELLKKCFTWRYAPNESVNKIWSRVPKKTFVQLEVLSLGFSGSTFAVLSVPDKPYTIHSDASQIGIAACLSQKCGDKCYPIAYASQKLSKTQQSWSTIEREAFAIVWSLKKFEVWVFGTELNFILIITLYPTNKSAPQSARLQRWAFALQKFNVTIKHCPGVKMPHADALSRLV